EVRADVASDRWQSAVSPFKPDIVFHLAAQPLVGAGFTHPYETFRSNIQGTAEILQFVAQTPSVVSVVVVTTDKVYDVRQPAPYAEESFLGGLDPYAASKSAAELVVASWPSGAAQ